MTARSPNHSSSSSTPLSEKLCFSLYKSITFLSRVLPLNSITLALNFWKSLPRVLLSKTLNLFCMDDFFADDDDFFAVDRRPPPPGGVSEDDADKIYFVPYRWWKEAWESLYGDADGMRGVLYTASSGAHSGPVKVVDNNSDSEILLNLRREEGNGKSDPEEEGFSGCEYALVSESVWLRALKWHNDSNEAVKDVGSLLAAEDCMEDVFPLQIRLSVLWETNSLVVKIRQKDNAFELYKRACNIFNIETDLLCIWDFLGQTTVFFLNDRIDHPGQPEEILLELQVYELSDSMKGREGMKDEMAVEQAKMEDSLCSSSVKTNGSTDYVNSYFMLTNSPRFCSSYRGAGFLGLRGLQNLGNTCFMNSAIQCVVHTPKLVDYFLGDYGKEINYENPLGMKGELALAFGDLLRKLWAPGAMPVAPRVFKLKLASFAPQFSGFNQHDSQEFLAFLLDGLHEDLNRVKYKPYIEARDADGCPDEAIAEEYWQNHRARNDSIIVDLCQGQYRSRLICPVCKKVSVTFDPFMYLSLPVPSATMRTMTVTVVSTDGTTLPSPVTVSVPKCGRWKDLIQALSIACSLRSDETLLVAEIYNNRILRYLEEPSDALALIRDDDRLVAYRLPKDSESSLLVVFTHYQTDRDEFYWDGRLHWKRFGVPLVARMSNISDGSDIRKQFLKLLNPCLMPVEDALNDYDDAGNTANEDSKMEDNISLTISDVDANSDSDSRDDPHLGTDFRFQLTDGEQPTEASEIKMNDSLLVSELHRRFYVHVFWSDKMVDQYDTCLLSLLPEVFKPGLFEKRPQESISLYKCLELFLKEEPLGPEDMWYCPSCKKNQQASKKLDLWRLPEILVIHLKRFSYSRYFKSKLETFVDFPIDDLDLSSHIGPKANQLSNRYMLYAVSNHYGVLGAGHYTAFVHCEWFSLFFFLYFHF
ncbi:hypothetical protein L1049_007878 [Liquidambar formosana]|uniref:Ubiquitin carboxyl-terminal hydrolase n=1 Tax=Liquidambar formosana TaxID=63359 RepID=A0AAP0X1X3_LIQFO